MIAYSVKYADGGVLATAQLFNDAVGVFYVTYPYSDEEGAVGTLNQLVADMGYQAHEFVRVKDVRLENPAEWHGKIEMVRPM